MSEKLSIPCPGCSAAVRVSIKDLKPDKSVKCSSCKAVLDLEGVDIEKLIADGKAEFFKNLKKGLDVKL